MPSQSTTWLQFALQQMAAESYLDGINLQDNDQVEERLLLGNNRPGAAPLSGATRFTNVLVDEFLSRYQMVSHHANDSTGFSATLMRERDENGQLTNNFTLSFRSTEYNVDRARDGFGADAEIALGSGFAVGQLMAMEDYYQNTVRTLLPSGAVLNVTGYSLGGHLATVFTELKEAA